MFLADNNPVELEEIVMKDATMTRALEAKKSKAALEKMEDKISQALYGKS